MSVDSHERGGPSRSQTLSEASQALAALSHPQRFALVAAVLTRGSASVAELAAALDTDVKSVSKDVVRLLASGVLRREGPAIVADLPHLDELSVATVELTAMYRAVPADSPLRRHLSHGRIVDLPKRPEHLEAIAAALAELLPVDQTLTEAQVNALLENAGSDVAALRRLLVDLRFVQRCGSADYRRTERRPEAGTPTHATP